MNRCIDMYIHIYTLLCVLGMLECVWSRNNFCPSIDGTSQYEIYTVYKFRDFIDFLVLFKKTNSSIYT